MLISVSCLAYCISVVGSPSLSTHAACMPSTCRLVSVGLAFWNFRALREKKQFHAPSHSIAPLDSVLVLSAQRTPAYYKYYAVVNMFGVVNLLSHSDLLSRRIVCGRHFPGNCTSKRDSRRSESGGRSKNISISNFQSEVGEVFGEIGGELPAKFGRRFSSFFCWENRQKHFPPKLHRKFHHQTSLRGSGLWRALKTLRRIVIHYPVLFLVRRGPLGEQGASWGPSLAQSRSAPMLQRRAPWWPSSSPSIGICLQAFREMPYAGSELPQGPFSENNLFALKVGLRWVFVSGLKWVQKWVFGYKNGSKVGRNPLFIHFKPISGFSRKPTFQPV